MTIKAENKALKTIIVNLYNRSNHDGQQVYTEVEKITSTEVILLGVWDKYYLTRTCFNTETGEEIWADWYNTVDGTGPVGEQHQ